MFMVILLLYVMIAENKNCHGIRRKILPKMLLTDRSHFFWDTHLHFVIMIMSMSSFFFVMIMFMRMALFFPVMIVFV